MLSIRKPADLHQCKKYLTFKRREHTDHDACGIKGTV